MSEKPSVLFVCIHNAGRSQMAAAYLTHLAGDRVVVFGRQGLFVPDNTHHALAMGAEAAAAVRPDGSFDRNRWTASLDRFGDHVVED